LTKEEKGVKKGKGDWPKPSRNLAKDYQFLARGSLRGVGSGCSPGSNDTILNRLPGKGGGGVGRKNMHREDWGTGL